MTKASLNRTLALLWLAIGVLLLLFLVGVLGMIVMQAIRNAGAGSEAVRIATADQPMRQEPRAIRYSPPLEVRGTQTKIVMVSYGTDHEPAVVFDGGYASSGPQTANVNVIFVDANGARLLLDRPAYIREVSYPRMAPEAPSDPPRDWITYVVALDDTNGNGELEHRDAATLYITDLDGRNFRPVVRPPLRYHHHSVLDPARILVYALEPPAGQEVEEKRMRQRAFIYEVASGRLSPYAAMDSAAARAGRILQR
jgi:hypothetical protein